MATAAGRRDGVRDGGGRAELVDPGIGNPDAEELLRRRTQRIDVLYREWSRRGADVEALRELHVAIGQFLEDAAAQVAP